MTGPSVRFGVVHDGLNREHALAFAIDFQGHLSVMDLEDRDVIGRFLDHDSPSSRILFPRGIMRPVLIAEDRFDAVQIQGPARTVNQRLEYLVHLSSGLEQQVAAIFRLED